MADRVVTLRVEARVDANDPSLCSELCPFVYSDGSAIKWKCSAFNEATLESTDDGWDIRCPACLSAEQAAGKP